MRRIELGLLACALTALMGCAQDLTVGPETTTRIGSTGGTATSHDGLLSLQFAQDALFVDTTISIRMIEESGTNGLAASGVYELSPSGLAFEGPVKITIDVPPLQEDLVIANFDGPVPVALPGAVYDPATGRATAELRHFSRYGLWRRWLCQDGGCPSPASSGPDGGIVPDTSPIFFNDATVPVIDVGTTPTLDGGFIPVPDGGFIPGPDGGFIPVPDGGFIPGPDGGFIPVPDGGFTPVPDSGLPLPPDAGFVVDGGLIFDSGISPPVDAGGLGYVLEVEPNDLSTTAHLIGTSGTILGAIAPAGDEDWFRVTLPTGTAYRISASTHTRLNDRSSCSGIDTLVSVYDDNQMLLSSNNDFNGTPCSRVDILAMGGQTIYLQVQEARTGQQAPYFLTVEAIATGLVSDGGVATDTGADASVPDVQ